LGERKTEKQTRDNAIKVVSSHFWDKFPTNLSTDFLTTVPLAEFQMIVHSVVEVFLFCEDEKELFHPFRGRRGNIPPFT